MVSSGYGGSSDEGLVNRSACKTCIIACISAFALAISAAKAEPLAPRHTPRKPAKTVLRGADDPGRVVLKLREGSGARLRAGRFEGEPGFDAAALMAVLAAHRVRSQAVRRLFPLPEADLEARRQRAQRRLGRQVADLNLYFRIRLPAGGDAARLCDALNALPFVELATPAPRPMPPPTDLAPPTANFRGFQGYRGTPPSGIGAVDVARLPGADGSGMTFVDIEQSWTLDHEDLELPPSTNIDSRTIPSGTEPDHGTAVLGILAGLDNDYGITGIAPAATARVAPSITVEGGLDLAGAIALATAALDAGDVILIEQQTCVCNSACDPNTGQEGLGPIEWLGPSYDAIVTAVGLDITVVEAAGNGSLDLDDPNCLGYFDGGGRADSGAILVGAGAPANRERLGFSNYGSRLDVQGWGSGVTTTGFVPLAGTDDIRQRYTAGFSGTSSAAAVVAGAALAIQGAHLARGEALLDPLALRSLLVTTGTPQYPFDPPSETIGPLPNLPAALAAFLADCNDGVDNDGDGPTDHPADADCTSSADDTEYALQVGDLLVSDDDQFDGGLGGSGTLFRVDPATGIQTVVRSGGFLVDPVSLSAGEGGVWIVDFTRASLSRVVPETGSAATLTAASLLVDPWGVAVDPSGDLLVSDSTAAHIVRVDRENGSQQIVSSGGSFSRRPGPERDPAREPGDPERRTRDEPERGVGRRKPERGARSGPRPERRPARRQQRTPGHRARERLDWSPVGGQLEWKPAASEQPRGRPGRHDRGHRRRRPGGHSRRSHGSR
jgi:hypothetical protein